MEIIFSGKINLDDFDVTSYYTTKCPECDEKIIEEDYPLDLDFVKCKLCGLNFKIEIN